MRLGENADADIFSSPKGKEITMSFLALRLIAESEVRKLRRRTPIYVPDSVLLSTLIQQNKMSPKEPTRNINQKKAIAYFDRLNIMDAMQAIEEMKVILDRKIEEKKSEFSDELLKLNSMQEKIKQ